MKKISFILMLFASLSSAASIVCQTTDLYNADKIVGEEAYGVRDAMPTKGFMTLEKTSNHIGHAEFVNIIFDDEKAFMCVTQETDPDHQTCEVFSSIGEIQKKLGIHNKILSYKAFYTTPRGLLSVVTPVPRHGNADNEEGGVEICFIR